MRSLVYVVGASIDGYIAAPDGSPDVLGAEPDILRYIAAEYPDTVPTHVRGSLGLGPERHRFDAVVMGRRTYEPALTAGVTSPYAHLEQIVVSGHLRSTDPSIRVVGEPRPVVQELKAGDGLDIWLAGGGALAGSLVDLVDEIVLKTYPVVFGDGVRVVDGAFDPTAFARVHHRDFASGASITTFTRKGADPDVGPGADLGTEH